MIVRVDREKGLVEVVPEDYEDLWRLSRALKEGDLVFCRTRRVLKLAGEKVRVPLTLGIELEKVQLRDNDLRLLGRIAHAPRKYSYLKGFREGISVRKGDVITIHKAKGLGELVSRLKKRARKKEKLIVVCLDFRDCCVAEVSDDIKVIWEGSNPAPKGAEYASFFREVADVLERKGGVVLLAGPEIPIASFSNYLASNKPSILARIRARMTCGYGGLPGLYEFLRRGGSAIEGVYVLEASRAFERAWVRTIKGEEVVVGLAEVKAAAESGALEQVFVLSSLLKSPEVSEVLEEAEKKGGKVYIIPGSTEMGHRLKVLGGILGTLRFPIYRGSRTPR